MVSIQVNIDSVKRYMDKLDKYLKGNGIERIGKMLLESTQERFKTKTAPDDSEWQRNALMTIALKGRDDPLIDTGAMLRSIEMEIEPYKIHIGTDDEKAPKHQFGIDVPKREFLGLSEMDEEKLINMLVEDLERM